MTRKFLTYMLIAVFVLLFVLFVPATAEANGRRALRGRSTVLVQQRAPFFNTLALGVGCGLNAGFVPVNPFFAAGFAAPVPVGGSQFFFNESRVGLGLGARSRTIQQSNGLGGNFLLNEQRGPFGGLRSQTIQSSDGAGNNFFLQR
jgi:hypothetical protein